MSSFHGHVSVDGEIVGVAACVNNVVAAFQYGASVLARAKQQRAADGVAPLPKWLEDSVSDAPDEIEREKRRGIERFGRPYEIGDDQAIFALQQITIQLQCSLLMKIVNLDDQKTDFKALARAADQARNGTLTELMALRKRLTKAEIEGDMSNLRIFTEMPPPPPMVTDTREVVMSPVGHTDILVSPPAVDRMSTVRRISSNVPQPLNVAPRDSVVSRMDSLSMDVPQNLGPVPRDSVVSRMTSISSNVSQQPFAAHRDSVNSRASSNVLPQAFSAQRDSVASRTSSSAASHPSSSQRDSVPNHYETLSPASSNSQRRSSGANSMHSQTPSYHSSQAPEAMRSNSYSFSEQPTRTMSTSMSEQPTRTMSTSLPATNYTSRELAELPKPNRKNNYLGFCKCAWRLQGGDEKAFMKSKDWTQRNAASSVYSLACDRFKCEFKSPYKSSGNPNVIWNKLIVDDEHGMKYRWSFLAKSHVTQRNVVNEDYSYQCQFCVFQGLQVPVMNLQMLLEHIGADHRRNAMSDVILDRTSCVSDRICRDGEKFDINLYPPMQGVEAGAFITPVLGDMRDPLWRPTEPVEKYSETARKPSVFELYG